MKLNELMSLLWKMNAQRGVDGEAEIVLEHNYGPNLQPTYLHVTHVDYNEVNNQVRFIHDEGITPEVWAEALREKKNNPL